MKSLLHFQIILVKYDKQDALPIVHSHSNIQSLFLNKIMQDQTHSSLASLPGAEAVFSMPFPSQLTHKICSRVYIIFMTKSSWKRCTRAEDINLPTCGCYIELKSCYPNKLLDEKLFLKAICSKICQNSPSVHCHLPVTSTVPLIC